MAESGPTVYPALSTTRASLHGIAELLLAGPQFRASGTIRLAPRPGGFGTLAPPELRFESGFLVAGDQRLPCEGRTYRAVGEAAGIDAGAPEGVYRDGSGAKLDDTIAIDSTMVSLLVSCFQRGEQALRRLAPHQTPVLWPEHFDLGITENEINYGVSAGDDWLNEPFAYVGPWRPREGEFWNAPFGAARPMRELPDTRDVVAFLEQGRRLAA